MGPFIILVGFVLGAKAYGGQQAENFNYQKPEGQKFEDLDNIFDAQKPDFDFGNGQENVDFDFGQQPQKPDFDFGNGQENVDFGQDNGQKWEEFEFGHPGGKNDKEKYEVVNLAKTTIPDGIFFHKDDYEPSKPKSK